MAHNNIILKIEILLYFIGLRPHECNICQKRFSQRANMIKHQLSHTGINK